MWRSAPGTGRVAECCLVVIATDTVKSVEAIGAILDKAQEAFGTEPYWVSVDVDPCASSVMPSENKRCPRSK